METLDPGHHYRLQCYDLQEEDFQFEQLTFMKRTGEGYPGNHEAYAGTNLQEVIRVLIDRVKYLNKQIPCVEDITIIWRLRECLLDLELRACKRHNLEPTKELRNTVEIELLPTCSICGHTVCKHRPAENQGRTTRNGIP